MCIYLKFYGNNWPKIESNCFNFAFELFNRRIYWFYQDTDIFKDFILAFFFGTVALNRVFNAGSCMTFEVYWSIYHFFKLYCILLIWIVYWEHSIVNLFICQCRCQLGTHSTRHFLKFKWFLPFFGMLFLKYRLVFNFRYINVKTKLFKNQNLFMM